VIERSFADGLAIVGLCALAASALLVGCARKEEIYAPADYVNWARTTSVVLDYPIPGHENRLRIPRMNAKGFTAVSAQKDGKLVWDFPEDTVIVKEVYASVKPASGVKPIQLTIMAKDPADKRAQGGWLWITKDLPGGKETVFTGNFCVTCHANANERYPYGDGNPNEDFRDYVYFVPGEKTKNGQTSPQVEGSSSYSP
jgi:hypothetical protein